MTSEKTPLLIVNESAGATPELRDRLTRVADEKGCAIETARGPGDIPTLVHRAADGGSRRLIVAGGDGTINATVNAVVQASHAVELAIVPLGTGNDLARALDLPRDDPEAALELATAGTSQPIDLVRLADGSEGFFVNACSAGFAGKVCANITPEDKTRWGGFAYWLTAVSMLSELPTYRIRMKFEHHEFEGKVHCVVVANGRYVGGGFPIAPTALLDDGAVNVTIVPEQPPWELLYAGLDFMLDRDGDSERLYRYRSRRVRLDSDPPMPFSVDGEQKERLAGRFEIVPKTIRIVPGPDAVALSKHPHASEEAESSRQA